MALSKFAPDVLSPTETMNGGTLVLLDMFSHIYTIFHSTKIRCCLRINIVFRGLNNIKQPFLCAREGAGIFFFFFFKLPVESRGIRRQMRTYNGVCSREDGNSTFES